MAFGKDKDKQKDVNPETLEERQLPGAGEVYEPKEPVPEETTAYDHSRAKEDERNEALEEVELEVVDAKDATLLNTMADQGISIPDQQALVADEPPPDEPICYDFPKTPWQMLPHETMFSQGLQICRVPGGWIYTDTFNEIGIASVFVPLVPQANDPSIWK